MAIGNPILHGVLGVSGYPWPNDSFDTYADAAELNTLNQGSQWATAWIDRRNPFGNTDINDDMESYSDSASVQGLNGGTGWNTVYVADSVDTPVAVPLTGSPPQTASLSTVLSGTSIYYTTNGSTPTTASQLYTASIPIAADPTTLKAFARKTNYGNSAVGSWTYFTPPVLSVTSSLVARWESISITGSNDGDPVSTWLDQSGQSRNATASGTARPLYKVNIFGSSPALLFDGSNDLLNFSGSGVPNFTVFQVYKPNSNGYPAATITWRAASGNRSGFALNGANKHITTYNSSGGETNNKVMATGLTAGTKHILCWTYNGTTLVSRDNGANESNSSNDQNYGAANECIGLSYQYFNGYLAAILVYDSVLSAGDITSVETYLNFYYPSF